MKSPLEQIKNWFSSLNQDHQNELASLAGHFHFDRRIQTAGTDKVGNLFVEYLKEEGLDELEIVRRTLFIVKLIDFSLSGRDTEAGWTEILDRLLSIRSKMQIEGKDITWLDKQLNTHHERKEAWINITETWNALNVEVITNKKIADWYFFSM